MKGLGFRVRSVGFNVRFRVSGDRRRSLDPGMPGFGLRSPSLEWFWGCH